MWITLNINPWYNTTSHTDIITTSRITQNNNIFFQLRNSTNIQCLKIFPKWIIIYSDLAKRLNIMQCDAYSCKKCWTKLSNKVRYHYHQTFMTSLEFKSWCLWTRMNVKGVKDGWNILSTFLCLPANLEIHKEISITSAWKFGIYRVF